jgi:hypothetical protein
MDECREVGFERSRTDVSSQSFCDGKAFSPGVSLADPLGTFAVGVEGEISAEVCGERSAEIGKSDTQVVKLPGMKGKRTVACAQGVSAIINGFSFTSLSGDFSVCLDACPSPACLEASGAGGEAPAPVMSSTSTSSMILGLLGYMFLA